jgi:hypothetical protein
MAMDEMAAAPPALEAGSSQVSVHVDGSIRLE